MVDQKEYNKHGVTGTTSSPIKKNSSSSGFDRKAAVPTNHNPRICEGHSLSCGWCTLIPESHCHLAQAAHSSFRPIPKLFLLSSFVPTIKTSQPHQLLLQTNKQTNNTPSQQYLSQPHIPLLHNQNGIQGRYVRTFFSVMELETGHVTGELLAIEPVDGKLWSRYLGYG